MLCIASDELKQLVSKIDIVKPIVAAMNKYKDNCYFYSYGLGALSSLSLVGKYKKEALNRNMQILSFPNREPASNNSGHF